MSAIAPHDFKVGDRVQSLRTGQVGTIFDIKHVLLDGQRAPDMIFIELDSGTRSGIVSEPGALVKMALQ